MPSATKEGIAPTAQSLTTAEPVSEKERIFTLDVFRGFALLGILLMNVQDISMPGAAYMNPTAYGDLHGANYWVWLLSHLLADEKFITIFSMLFGAGILLMTSHIEAAGRRSAGLHYRRMGWLILFGMLHGYLLWSGDILFSYGVSGLLVFLFRKCRPRTLLIVGAVSLTVTPALMSLFGWSMALWPPDDLQSWREGLWMPSPAAIAQELAAFRGSWLTQMEQRVNDSLLMETVYFVVWTFWRVFGLMLIGMALLKMGILSGKRPARVYLAMIAIAVAVGVPVILYGTHRDFATGWDFRTLILLRDGIQLLGHHLGRFRMGWPAGAGGAGAGLG
jgi:uncharacterized protein